MNTMKKGLLSPQCRAPAVIALDLESVLTPEIWQAVARQTGIRRLSLTTRDRTDYPCLMRQRIRTCRKHGLTLARLRQMVRGMSPLPGAVKFLRWAQSHALAVIVSDTFHELAGPLVAKLGRPLVICNWLETDADGYIRGFQLRDARGKEQAIRTFKKLGFRVAAVGDSHNDLDMLAAADVGILFRPCAAIARNRNDFGIVRSYAGLKKALRTFADAPG
ncbi:MAG: bifunctional phosphoserine phosphatase/homoserine phosphotransferase ThrH [Verrucomicrobia bacterium]|nr:bifunctional phosphoserine phosphatase/homoserine phosphotransferase ThrH [Verrucomicrobiota bacterium]